MLILFLSSCILRSASSFIGCCRGDWLEPIAGKGLDPMFHPFEVSVLRSPVVELVAKGAGLQDYKARVALNAVAARRPAVLRAIDLEELNLIASIFRSEFIDDFVPLGHEFDAVFAGGHKEIDDNKCFWSSLFHQVLELTRVIGHSALSFVPPVQVHFS